MTLEIDEIDCSFAGVTWAFYCGDIASNMMRKDLPFQLPRYHPNSRFKLKCVYKYSGDKITKQRRHYTIQLFLQAACSRQQDKPVSILLGVIRGDKIPLKSSHGPDANSITWKTEIISINADNCIPLQPKTCNLSISVQQALVVTWKFWLKFNDSSLGELTILTHLTDMFLNQSDCDAHFSFEDGQSIGAHINILKIRSPVFAAMFEHEMEESKTGRIRIQDVQADIFQQLLHFIYFGRTKTPLTEEIAHPLYVAADKYNIKDLRNECVFYLRSNIRIDNAIFLIIFAHLHSIENLKKSAIVFAKVNARQIVEQDDWANLIKGHPDLSVEVTRSFHRIDGV